MSKDDLPATFPRCTLRNCGREADVLAWRSGKGKSQRRKLCAEHATEWTKGHAFVGKASLRPISLENMRAAFEDFCIHG